MDPTSGAFEAEADLEVYDAQRIPGRQRTSSGKAKDALDVAAGGLYPNRTPDETTALLADDGASTIADDYRAQDVYSEWPGAKDYEGLPWYKTPSIYWMLPPFFLFALAFGGVIIPKLNLVKDLICRDYLRQKMIEDPSLHYDPIRFGADNDMCRIPAVESRTSLFMMGDTVLAGMLTAFTSPYIGAMADRYGRNKIMVIASAGGIIKEISSIFAAEYMDTFPVGLLYIGFIADGICGSFIAGMAVAHAYASDTTAPLKRNVAFAYFHVCLFTGIAIGPVIGSYVIELTGTILTMFYIAFGCHLFYIFLLLFVIPESLPKYRQMAAREKHAHDLVKNGRPSLLSQLKPKAFFAPLKVLYPLGGGSSPGLRRNLVLLCSIDTIMFGVAMGAMNVFILYSNYQFGWNQAEQARYVSITNSCRVMGLFLILPIVNRLVRGASKTLGSQRQSGCDKLDLGIIRAGVFIDTLGFLGTTLSRRGDLFTIAGCVTSLGAVAAPTLQSAETKHVPHHRVGQLLGATGMLHSLARVVAPLIFSVIFSATIGKFNQAVFVSLFTGFAAAFVLTWFLKPGVYLQETLTPVASRDQEQSDPTR